MPPRDDWHEFRIVTQRGTTVSIRPSYRRNATKGERVSWPGQPQEACIAKGGRSSATEFSGCRHRDSVAAMPTPEFVAGLRAHIGHDLLWLSTAAGVVLDADGRVLLGRRSDTGNSDSPAASSTLARSRPTPRCGRYTRRLA